MFYILIIIILVLSSAGCTSPNTQNAPVNQTIDGITIPTSTGSPTPAEARQIAAAAYVYGYPSSSSMSGRPIRLRCLRRIWRVVWHPSTSS